MNDEENLDEKLKYKYEKHDILLKNIKENLPELEELLRKVSGFSYEDRMYRFYHGSFKVYWFQDFTEEMVSMFRKISPHNFEGDDHRYNPFCSNFEQIRLEGTGWEHKLNHNQKWLMITRPIVEAFLHAKYFLEMAVKYGKELNDAPDSLPSGWAALLELYKIR